MHKEKRSPTMIGNPIKVVVKAKIDPITKKVKFDEEWEVIGVNGKHTNPIVIPFKQPPTNIQFHLDDDTGLHLRFYDEPRDAIYVSVGTECPKSRGDGDGQITFRSSSHQLLKIRDANMGDPCDMKYTLRFEGDDNIAGNQEQPYVHDPDLKNGGGGIGGFNQSSLYLLIGGAALAALGYVAYLTFTK